MKEVQADPREMVVLIDDHGQLNVKPVETALQEILGWGGLDWALVTWMASASIPSDAVPEVRELLESGRLQGPRDPSQRRGLILQVIHGLDWPAAELWTIDYQYHLDRPATLGEWRRQRLPESGP